MSNVSESFPLTKGSILVARDSLVRDLVDPIRTLPEVSLQVVSSAYEAEYTERSRYLRERMQILHEGQKSGWCSLITRPVQGFMKFDVINLDEIEYIPTAPLEPAPQRERPRGLGLASYLIAIETAHARDLPFEAIAADIPPASNHIWQILCERGAAVTIEDKSLGGYGEMALKYRAPVL